MSGVAPVGREGLEAAVLDPVDEHLDRVLERERAILGEQVREAVQGVGDGLGLRGIEQLGDGGEVEVLAAEPDRVAPVGRREAGSGIRGRGAVNTGAVGGCASSARARASAVTSRGT